MEYKVIPLIDRAGAERITVVIQLAGKVDVFFAVLRVFWQISYCTRPFWILVAVKCDFFNWDVLKVTVIIRFDYLGSFIILWIIRDFSNCPVYGDRDGFLSQISHPSLCNCQGNDGGVFHHIEVGCYSLQRLRRGACAGDHQPGLSRIQNHLGRNPAVEIYLFHAVLCFTNNAVRHIRREIAPQGFPRFIFVVGESRSIIFFSVQCDGAQILPPWFRTAVIILEHERDQDSILVFRYPLLFCHNPFCSCYKLVCRSGVEAGIIIRPRSFPILERVGFVVEVIFVHKIFGINGFAALIAWIILVGRIKLHSLIFCVSGEHGQTVYGNAFVRILSIAAGDGNNQIFSVSAAGINLYVLPVAGVAAVHLHNEIHFPAVSVTWAGAIGVMIIALPILGDFNRSGAQGVYSCACGNDGLVCVVDGYTAGRGFERGVFKIIFCISIVDLTSQRGGRRTRFRTDNYLIAVILDFRLDYAVFQFVNRAVNRCVLREVREGYSFLFPIIIDSSGFGTGELVIGVKCVAICKVIFRILPFAPLAAIFSVTGGDLQGIMDGQIVA